MRFVKRKWKTSKILLLLGERKDLERLTAKCLQFAEKKKKKRKRTKKKKKRRESDLKSQGFQQKLEHNIPRPRQAELGLSHHPKADYLSQKPEMN